MGALLPLGSPKPPPLTLHSHPLSLTPGLAHFGGWGSPCSLCICAIGGSPQPRPWRPSSVPGGGAPGEGSLPPWAAHDLWVQQSLAATCFLRLGLLPQSLFSGASVYTAHPSGALWPISQHLWGSRRALCSAGPSSTPPAPILPERGSSLCFVSHHRYWDREVLRTKKDAREPSLMKAIIKCYWKFYFGLGLLTFLEVKAFPYCALLLSVCRSVLRWMRWAERGQWFKVWR